MSNAVAAPANVAEPAVTPQIYREMGFGSYRTAWYMCHRVRVGLANEDFRKLMGVVEVDETFLARKAEDRH